MKIPSQIVTGCPSIYSPFSINSGSIIKFWCSHDGAEDDARSCPILLLIIITGVVTECDLIVETPASAWTLTGSLSHTHTHAQNLSSKGDNL